MDRRLLILMSSSAGIPPHFVSAEVGTVNATTVAVTFDANVSASDYTAGATIKVNGSSATISSATRQANHALVYYVVTPAVVYGDTVTWEYAAASGNIVGETGGVALADVSAQTVTNNVIYLLRDEFTTDESTPLTSPRTCEPGPGTLTLAQTAGTLDIVGGKIAFTESSGSFGQQYIVSAAQTRVAGLAASAVINYSSVTAMWFGWNPNSTPDTPAVTNVEGLYVRSVIDYFDPEVLTQVPYSLGADIHYAVVLRTAGAFLIADGKLLWVSKASNNATAYACFSNKSSAGTLDNFSIANLGGAWATDYGIATNRVALPASPTATTSAANALIEFTWTPAANEVLELDTRRTDADNRWITRCDQAGGTIKLIERNASTETERASEAQTWNVGTAYRIVVIQDGNTIKDFVANARKFGYFSASLNNAATGVSVAGFATGSNLVCYPRDVTALLPGGF